MLKTDLTQYTAEMDGISGVMGLDGLPATMLGANPDGGKAVTYRGSFGYGPGDLYGMGTFLLPGMGSQASLFQNGIIMGATGFTTGAVITSNGKNMACEVTSAQPTNIKKENKVLGFFNPLKKSWNSFKEIGTDIKTAAKTRGNKAFDSPYDFVNWVTIGASDGIYTGAVDRTSKKNESFYDFTNYWTVGLPDLVKGATAPEEQFSKEHWLSSFGLATSVIGGVKAVTPTKPMGGVSEGLAKPKEKIKSAEENPHKGTGNNGSTTKNKFPDEELPKDGKILSYSLKDRKIKGIDGRTGVDFVIDKNGNLVIGKRHHTLGNKDEVLAAGQLKINGQGEVRRITNESGHYRPTPKEAMDYPQLLKDAGVNVKGAWIEFYSYKIDADGFINDSTKVVSKKLTE